MDPTGEGLNGPIIREEIETNLILSPSPKKNTQIRWFHMEILSNI